MTSVRKVVVAPFASEDISSLLDFALTTMGIEQALALDVRIHETIDRLEQFADRGRAVPELRDHSVVVYRELLVSPYRVVYRVEPTEIWIIAVVDHHRNLKSFLEDRARRDRRGS